MPTTLVLVWQQVLLSLGVLADRTARICAGTALAMILVSILSAPDADPGTWGWIGLLLVGASVIVAIVLVVASRQPDLTPANQQHRLTAAVTFGIVGLAINLSFSLWSTILLALAMTLVARQAMAVRPGAFPWLLCATLIVLTPFWVWSALDAWRASLLLLFPLAALAYLSSGHIRDAYTEPVGERLLSLRGHRMAAWMGMLLGGLLVVTGGILFSASYPWVALGGIATAMFVALEAGVPRPEDKPGRYAGAICDAAFVVAALSWLIGL